MPGTAKVLMSVVAVLAAVGFADAGGPTTASSYSPASATPAQAAAQAGLATVRWDEFHDRAGNPLPDDPVDAVGAESLYWKDLSSATYLKSSAKVQNPSPTNRTPMSFRAAGSTTCMDPSGDYVYEAIDTNLYRFSTVNGSMTTYSLAYSGGLGCATDGRYIYRPDGTTMYKYTLTGAFVNSTTTDISCDAYSISCCRDTIWFTDDRYNGVTLYGYACSDFDGDSISHEATWNVGTGTYGIGNVAWDGYYFYMAWIGTEDITFKRFYPDRTL